MLPKLPATALYDDVIVKNAGRNDCALITDFTIGAYKLLLGGAKNDCFLGASGEDKISGSGLFYDSNSNDKLDSKDELIAIIRSGNNAKLTAANTVNTAQFL